MDLSPEDSNRVSTNIESSRLIPDHKSSLPHDPARASSPPPAADRRLLEAKRHNEGGKPKKLRSRTTVSDSARIGGLDAEAVDTALLRELQRSGRESTPSASPHRKRQRINGDRLVQSASTVHNVTSSLC